jgi:N-acetyl-alpha-D-glucosaminyl L-malate synthase BshA
MTRPLNIGITCFPTFGGSGLVATEVGLAMARRGHRVHFIARDLPVRLSGAREQVYFHEVTEADHPTLQQSSAYPIALASRMIEVSLSARLDILHVHYAVPHATAAWMAREVLADKAPRVVTTLHGTDITLVGTDPSYLPITRFSILKSDAVTTPSESLRQATYEGLDIPPSVPVEVIPNFVDASRYAPAERNRAALQSLFPSLRDGEKVLFHVSNFRPVKRIQDVVAVFAAVNARQPCRLVMVGDGPERSGAERRLQQLGLSDRVAFLGKQDNFTGLLAQADVFLLPSQTESFGLAALEALACGIPVVATNVGGVSEVVTHGETGLLAPVGDVEKLAQHALALVGDVDLWRRYSGAARQDVLRRFQLEPAINRYETLYRSLARTRG